MTHPYKGLPPYSNWRKSVASIHPDDVDPVVSVPFTLSPQDRIATAGSCFAQHIARNLSSSGYHYLVTEDGDPDRNYQVFPARFGNIYTPRQLVQLFQRAYGLFVPIDDVWTRQDGKYVDPFRPQVEPDGFATVESLHADRDTHLAAVRAMFDTADVFIFTLGLTEGWRSKLDGAVFPLAPGVAGSPESFDDYEYHNFDVGEMIADLRIFTRYVRTINPALRMIFTVSPVPLVATYEKKHVLVATTYSKSALRVVAEHVTRADAQSFYFPSYEIITGQHSRHRYLAEDLREVTSEGVAHVMRIFGRHFFSPSEAATASPRPRPVDVREAEQEMRSIEAVVCDEEALDA